MIFLRTEDIRILDFLNLEFQNKEEIHISIQDCLRYNKSKETDSEVSFADWNRSIENLMRYGLLIKESNGKDTSFTLLPR